jgi:hypothetical protein
MANETSGLGGLLDTGRLEGAWLFRSYQILYDPKWYHFSYDPELNPHGTLTRTFQ